MIGFSTCWNMHRHRTAYGIIKGIKELGFSKIEISHYFIDNRKLDEIIELKNKKEIEITSLHNFCPNPIYHKNQKGGGEIFSITSSDKEEVKLALKFTKKTIENAKRCDAKAVVLHSGRIEGMEEEVNELFQKLKKYGNNSEKYKSCLNKFIDKRNVNKNIYLERTIEALEKLDRYAKKLDILIGVENRYYPNEIPNFEEIKIILEHFSGNSKIGYWYDIGHAYVNEIMGMANYIDYLKNYKDRLIGVHLHDANGTSDHRAPSYGKINFNIIKDNLPSDCIKIMEVINIKKEEVKRGYEYLKKLFYE